MNSMQKQGLYPKAEEIIDTGEYPPRVGSYTPRPAYLPIRPNSLNGTEKPILSAPDSGVPRWLIAKF